MLPVPLDSTKSRSDSYLCRANGLETVSHRARPFPQPAAARPWASGACWEAPRTEPPEQTLRVAAGRSPACAPGGVSAGVTPSVAQRHVAGAVGQDSTRQAFRIGFRAARTAPPRESGRPWARPGRPWPSPTPGRPARAARAVEPANATGGASRSPGVCLLWPAFPPTRETRAERPGETRQAPSSRPVRQAHCCIFRLGKVLLAIS